MIIEYSLRLMGFDLSLQQARGIGKNFLLLINKVHFMGGKSFDSQRNIFHGVVNLRDLSLLYVEIDTPLH